ncbi:MFS transporter [Endozoicomonas sp. SM1973]|uniref:MFS transporter n=1 Tax=Spartinivicinus marinus TaxID=2994442 RepID=A0A853I1E9_9GAMM|nr:MFS transporter [Spartinivicinus marinus]MCX4028566.1 MFS transporter [Spartinivicinus marinus]NYZ67233.1 MFS transporter [Spartinivicinus marinus]
MSSSTNNNRLRNITLLLTCTMTVMSGATIAPALPDMQMHFQHMENAEFLVKLVLTIPAIFIAIFAPLVGWLLDHWKKKPVIILSVALYGLAGTSSYIFTDSLYAILAGRALLGIAVAGIMTSCTTLASDYFAATQLNKFMGLQAAFGGYGGVLFLLLGGFLADVNWTTPFLIYLTAFCILPAIIIYLYEPNTTGNTNPSNSSSLPSQDNTTSVAKGFIILCFFLAVAEVLVLYMVPTHFPFYLAAIEPVSNTQTGIAIATMLLTMSTVSMGYQKVKRYLSFAQLHGLGLLLFGGGFLLLSIMESYAGAYYGLILSGIGLGLIRPNLMVWLMSSIPPHSKGKIIGGISSCFFIGQFLSPLLTEPLVKAVDFAQTFQIIGLVIITLALLFVSYCGIQYVAYLRSNDSKLDNSRLAEK